jgi:hypothetical protein
MIDNIVNIDKLKFQLVMTGIDLVHEIFKMIECIPDIKSNAHAVRVNDISLKWSRLFDKMSHAAKTREVE